MTQGLIYMVDAQGGLHRMTPSAPESEDRMQALVAQYPELITDRDGDLLLVRREQPIAVHHEKQRPLVARPPVRHTRWRPSAR